MEWGVLQLLPYAAKSQAACGFVLMVCWIGLNMFKVRGKNCAKLETRYLMVKKTWFRVDVPLNQYPLNHKLYIYTWVAEH